MSIHAPRSEIWKLFDNVILLSRGATLYSGLASAATEHFEECGFELPAFVNPAEHLVDLAAVDNRSEEAEQLSDARVSQLKGAWHRKAQDQTLDGRTPPLVLDLDDNAKQPRVGFWRQLEVLTRRTTKVTIRDPMGLAGSLFEAISLSVITGWVFFQLGHDLTGIRSRQGCLYTASSLQGYIIIMFETYRLTIDIQIFDRERSERIVGVPAFLLSRRLSRLFLEDLPVPIIFSVVFYFMAGLRAEVATFLIFLALMIISQLITVTLSALCVAVSRDFAGASLLGNVAYTIQTFSCGYFVQSQQIPIYLRWMKWVVSSELVLVSIFDLPDIL